MGWCIATPALSQERFDQIASDWQRFTDALATEAEKVNKALQSLTPILMELAQVGALDPVQAKRLRGEARYKRRCLRYVQRQIRARQGR